MSLKVRFMRDVRSLLRGGRLWYWWVVGVRCSPVVTKCTVGCQTDPLVMNGHQDLPEGAKTRHHEASDSDLSYCPDDTDCFINNDRPSQSTPPHKIACCSCLQHRKDQQRGPSSAS
ncbi:hypothetical protein J4Q44_G00165790 [Coregonus suidteri]|uniref:Uncharacterized protein n=1 Tax=Coregonus suidteri TaxID=861788 RepID=A0AAN8LJ97_9TELE